MKKYSLLPFLLLATIALSGQEIWSLEQCVKYATAHVPTIQQANLDQQLAALDLKASKNEQLPNLRANSNLNVQLGRTIDPTTNSFNNQQIWSNGISVSFNQTLYAGGAIRNGIKQQEHLLESSKWQQAASINQLKLDVLAAYLSTLLAEDQLEQAQIDLKILNDRLENLEKQVQAGTRSVTERLELEAQVAQSEQNLVRTKYGVALAYANLKTVLFVPINQEIKLERTAFEDIQPVPYRAQAVYQVAQATNPDLKAQQAFLSAREYEIKTAQNALLPRLALFANLNTFFSSFGTKVVGFEPFTSTEEVLINGESSLIEREGAQAIFEDNAYFDQLNENFGQSIGVSLSIPIFSQGQNRVNIQRSEVNLLRSKLDYDNAKLQLNYAVQQALLDAQAAWAVYEKAVQNEATNKALVEKKIREYELGAINLLDYIVVRNQHQATIVQLLQAKYDYVYKSKIVALYQNAF